MATEHVKGIIDFFKTEFWLDFVKNHLKHPDELVYHAHLYVDTNVHPESMHPIMYAWWKAFGAPLDRSIDPMSPKKDVGALHGVRPTGYPGWDWFFRFNKDVVLGPMPPDLPTAEKGSNKLSWGRNYQNDFVKQFKFKVVGPGEDEIIRHYFTTKHWKETIANVMDPQVMHCHSNFYINFDPYVFQMKVLDELAKIGWRVDYVVPCVYDVKGQYTGKNVFLVGQPEKVFDTCWRYDPDCVIRPADDGWIFGKDPGFDNWRTDMYADVLKSDFYKMTEAEVAEVIASFR